MWKRHGVLRTRFRISPHPNIFLKAKEQSFVGRRQYIQANMDLEKLLVAKTNTARKEELERRHSNLHQDRHHVMCLTLVDEVLGPANYKSWAQHLDDARMATDPTSEANNFSESLALN